MSLFDATKRFRKALPDLKLLSDIYKPSGSLSNEDFWYHLKLLGSEVSGLHDMTKIHGAAVWQWHLGKY